MKKKILAIGLVVCMLVVAIGSATMAYFTDTEEATNVMVVGEIDIEQTETDADGNPFEDGQHLLPNVTIEKVVTVENVGRSDAFVRTLIAFEGNKEFVENKLIVDGDIINRDYVGQISVDGEEYTVYMYVHNTALAQGEKVTNLLNSFTLKPDVTQDEVAFAGEEYNVLVLTQAVQADGVANNAADALKTAFGPETGEDYDAYVAKLFGGIVPKYVATAADLAAALTADDEYIAVVLQNDIDVAITSLGNQTPGSGEYKLGGDDTKSITIDLNGKKLNITTGYWSAIGAKNDDATITIKNGSMTSTGNSAGTWNAWDLRFSNCNWNFENVDFLKAVALDNAGKTTNMNNVTITDEHNDDTYGLWITAEGQIVTLDNCTIDTTNATDGRGIKIDEQYVSAPEKVTLKVSNTKFVTEEKAAILVKSAAGADIELSNVDIRKVAADSVNAVWVDADAADSYDEVEVNGGSKILEGGAVSTLAALQDAINGAKDGDTIVLTGDITGTITVGELKNVTIDAKNNAIGIFKTDADTVLENVTLMNAELEYNGATADFGIVIDPNAQIKNLVISGCTFTGTGAKAGRGISGDNNAATITLKDCTFKDLGYPIYAWGSYEALTVDSCKFENIKSWAIMPQSGFDGDLTVTNCKFTNCQGGGLIKAGTLTAGHIFTFTDNTVTGCTIAGDHNWFQFNVSAGASVVSGNTKDDVAWTPGAADGLK